MTIRFLTNNRRGAQRAAAIAQQVQEKLAAYARSPLSDVSQPPYLISRELGRDRREQAGLGRDKSNSNEGYKPPAATTCLHVQAGGRWVVHGREGAFDPSLSLK